MSAPSWIARLRERCAATSQTAVINELRAVSGDRYPSGSVVSQVLAGTYPSDPARLRALVEGLYCGVQVHCPVLGEMALDLCERYQRAPFSAANPTRVALYRACRDGCDHSRLGESHE